MSCSRSQACCAAISARLCSTSKRWDSRSCSNHSTAPATIPPETSAPPISRRASSSTGSAEKASHSPPPTMTTTNPVTNQWRLSRRHSLAPSLFDRVRDSARNRPNHVWSLTFTISAGGSTGQDAAQGNAHRAARPRRTRARRGLEVGSGCARLLGVPVGRKL